jgi:CRP-like cAMP-binding protein
MTPAAANLDRCPFFEHFRPAHLERLQAIGTLVSFPKDAIIFDEDDADTRFYVLLSGRVALEMTSGDHRVPVETLFAGDELGWSAVLRQKKQFRARALEPVAAMAFEADELEEVFNVSPYLAREFLERLSLVIAERLASTRRQLGRALAGR